MFYSLNDLTSSNVVHQVGSKPNFAFRYHSFSFVSEFADSCIHSLVCHLKTKTILKHCLGSDHIRKVFRSEI